LPSTQELILPHEADPIMYTKPGRNWSPRRKKEKGVADVRHTHNPPTLPYICLLAGGMMPFMRR